MKLIIPSRIADQVEPNLHSTVPGCSVVHVDQAGIADGDTSDAEVLLRWWMSATTLRHILAAAPQLRWLHTPSAGVDGVLIPEVRKRQLLLTNSAGVHAVQIAEFVLMLMLSHAKRAAELLALDRHNTWTLGRDLLLNELYQKTLLIIGLGHIGQHIAQRAAAFGMRVYGNRRRPAPIAGVERVVGEHEWRELLPQADYLVLSAPLTPSTHGMIDTAAFAQMKPSAYLINVARGQIIDTAALIEALHKGQIAGAALDVVPEEPLPPEHPLWLAPNIWITPHISRSSPQVNERTIALFLENVRRYTNGEPLLNVVDQAAGY